MFYPICEALYIQTVIGLILFVLLLLALGYICWKDITISMQIEQLEGYIKRKEKESLGQPEFKWLKGI